MITQPTALQRLTRAQELLDQLVHELVAILTDNKRLRDELTAVTLERDELKRLISEGRS
jgi:cell division septum initiation protein DivIVA